MQPMNIPLRLRTHRPQLKPHFAILDVSSQLSQAFDSDILQTVLQPGQQIRHEFGHRSPVQHAARDALSDK